MMKRISACILFAALGCTFFATDARALRLPRDGDDWIRIEMDDLTVFTDAKESKAIDMAWQLLQLRAALQKVTAGMPYGDMGRTRIFIFDDREHFLEYAPFVNGSPNEHIHGYFVADPRANFLAMYRGTKSQGRRLILHEFTHAWLRHNLPLAPVWLGEGLAEFYSTFRGEKDNFEVGTPPRGYVDGLRHETWIPAREFLTVDHRSSIYSGGQHTGLFYAQSWAYAHYFLTQRERRARLFPFLETVRSMGDPAKACIQVFGITEDALQEEVRGHVRARKLSYFRIPRRESERPSHQSMKVDALAMSIELGDLLSSISNSEEGAADSHYRAALEHDPMSTRAHIGLAILSMRADRNEQARLLVENALEGDPRDPDALSLRGYLALLASETIEVEESASELRRQAHVDFGSSLEARPDHVETLGWYAASCPDTLAIDESLEAIRRAIELQPNLPSLEAVRVELLVWAEDLAGARQVYATRVRGRASPEEAASAARAIVRAEMEMAEELLDRNQASMALSILEVARDTTDDAELQAKLTAILDRARRASSQAEQAQVRRAQAGLLGAAASAVSDEEALAILSSLLEMEDLDPEIRSQAERLQRERQRD